MAKKTNGRGGARAGAGRKKIEFIQYAFNMRPDVYEIIKNIKGSKTAFINDAIREKAGK